MKLKDCCFLADENIHPDLVKYFKLKNYDIKTVGELNLAGKSDPLIIEESFKSDRIILTHDSDFGTLGIARKNSFKGIIYIRPGHINGKFIVEIVDTLFLQDIDIIQGTIIVVQRNNDSIKIRVRRQEN